MLQGSNKFKNHWLRWLFRPLRLAKFESLWIQVCSLVAIWVYQTVFPSFFFLFLNFDRVFSMIFTLIHCCSMPFTAGYFPFYSAILGFLGYHWFPPFAPLDTRTNVLANFPILEGPKRLAFVLSFSKASRFHFFKPTFWLLFLLSFFPGELIPFYQVEIFPTTFLHGSSFWVPRGTSPLFMNCWFPSPLIPFLHYYVVDRDISILILCVSWYAPLNYFNPNLALLHVPRILGT